MPIERKTIHYLIKKIRVGSMDDRLVMAFGVEDSSPDRVELDYWGVLTPDESVPPFTFTTQEGNEIVLSSTKKLITVPVDDARKLWYVLFDQGWTLYKSKRM